MTEENFHIDTAHGAWSDSRRSIPPIDQRRGRPPHVSGAVSVSDAPGLHATNFVLKDALGGSMASMQIIPQGKADGPHLLKMKVRVPKKWMPR